MLVDVFGLEAALLQRVSELAAATVTALASAMHPAASPPPAGDAASLHRALERHAHLLQALPAGCEGGALAAVTPEIALHNTPAVVVTVATRLIALVTAAHEYATAPDTSTALAAGGGDLSEVATGAVAGGAAATAPRPLQVAKAALRSAAAAVITLLHRHLQRQAGDLVLLLNVALRMLAGAARGAARTFESACDGAAFTYRVAPPLTPSAATPISPGATARADAASLAALRSHVALVAQGSQLDWFAERLSAAARVPAWQRVRAGGGADACSMCGAGFTLFSRKHHCRCCGVMVCGACSSRTAPLGAHGLTPAGAADPGTAGGGNRRGSMDGEEASGDGAAATRVCDACFRVLDLLPPPARS